MWRTIGITFKRNRGDGYYRTCGEASFQVVIFPLTFSQAKPPAVIVDHDGNMIRIFKSSRAAIECGIVKVPFRRSELPDELRKIVPIFFVAGAAAFGSKIILIPPLKFSAWRQWHSARRLAADQITTHGDHGLAALRPERGDDVGRPRSPITPANDRFIDFQSIHEGDDV